MLSRLPIAGVGVLGDTRRFGGELAGVADGIKIDGERHPE